RYHRRDDNEEGRPIPAERESGNPPELLARRRAARQKTRGCVPETLLGSPSFVALLSQEARLAARTAGGDLPWRKSIRWTRSRNSSRPRSPGSSASPSKSP